MPPPTSLQWSYCLNSGWRDSVEKKQVNTHLAHWKSSIPYIQRFLKIMFFIRCFFCFLGQFVTISAFLQNNASKYMNTFIDSTTADNKNCVPCHPRVWSLKTEKMLCKWSANPFTLFVPFLPFIFVYRKLTWGHIHFKHKKLYRLCLLILIY